MKTLFRALALGFVLGTAGTASLHADEALRRIQQSLRDQGFYYGPIDGTTGDETTQAVRRYQIRNGLPVNGQLDDATKRTIEKTGADLAATTGAGRTTRPTVRPVPTPDTGTSVPPRRPVPASTPYDDSNPSYRRPSVRPVPDPDARDRVRGDEGEEPAPDRRSRNQADDDEQVVSPRNYARPDLRADNDARFDRRADGDDDPPSGGSARIPRNSVLPSARLTELFASTPYEFAPPPVQSDVLRKTQGMLTRQGFYDGPLNGIPSPLVTEALTNYQGVNRLRKTGRLDVSTLGSLRLLPGRQRVAPRDQDGDGDGPRRGPGFIFEGRVVHYSRFQND